MGNMDINHVYQEGNQLADEHARYGADMMVGSWLIDENLNNSSSCFT